MERKDRMSSASKLKLNQLIWGTIVPIGLMVFLVWKFSNNAAGRRWVWE